MYTEFFEEFSTSWYITLHHIYNFNLARIQDFIIYISNSDTIVTCIYLNCQHGERKVNWLIVCCHLYKSLGLLLWHNITLSTTLLNYQISDEIKVVSLAYLSIFRSLLFIQRVRRFLWADSVMDRSGTLSPIASAAEHLIQAFHRIHFMATNNDTQHQQDPINSEYTCTRIRTEHTWWLSRTCTDI